MPFDPASRYSLTDAPQRQPGACWITRVVDGVFVDTGVDVQFSERGRLYLSVDAIREMAEGAGLLTPVAQALADSYESGHADGYQLAKKENDDVDALAHQLIGLANGLRARSGADSGHQVELEEEAGADRSAPVGDREDFGELPGVFVTDDEAHGSDELRPAGTRGQGDGASDDDGPAGVPSGAGDDGSLIV